MGTTERLKAALADRYRIEGEVGKGGMATVYLAEDLKHDRKVAIKVLDPELAAAMGPERFLSEIRTTANLSHPHILPLHDSGEADGLLFYVMPYVEGESLKDRLEREGHLPVEEAVRIATRIADALDSAHRDGVIHRDLKPANILFQKGEPVVADFGIALAVSAAGEGRLTETGLSLGTPFYMSPEQAAGDQTPTATSDVYSLGCVLYEMLTGDPPHTGSSAQAVLGKIILGDVIRPTQLRRTIPPNVEGAALKALERIPADRFDSVEGMARALRDEGFRHGVGAKEVVGIWNRFAVALASVAGMLAVATVALAWMALGREETTPEIVKFTVMPGENQAIHAGPGVDAALSPDGRRYLYVGTNGQGGTQLWRRSLDQLEHFPVPGTDDVAGPVFSPTGDSIAFFADGRSLQTMPMGGGEPFTVVSSGPQQRHGLDWGEDGNLYYSDSIGSLFRVPATGGQPEPLLASEGGKRYSAPDLLPGGRNLLVTVTSDDPEADWGVGVVSLDGGTPQIIFKGNMGRYLAPGYVVFADRVGQIWAAAFDPGEPEATAPAIRIMDGIAGVNPMLSEFSLSATGSLLFRARSSRTHGELVWVSRDGEEIEEIRTDPGRIRSPDLSPDGTRLAVDVIGESAELRLLSLQGDPPQTLLSTNSPSGHRPAWNHDGTSLSIMRFDEETGLYDIWTVPADGSGTPELTLDLGVDIWDPTWSSNGEWLAVDADANILAFRQGIESPPDTVVATLAVEEAPTFSPDGRFIAYVSAKSGASEVYVRPFPESERVFWQVSRGGGTGPVWNPEGGELFYRNGESQIVAVEVSTDSTFSPGEETVLFSGLEYHQTDRAPHYATLDGQRFLMIRTYGASKFDLVFVKNFQAEIRAILGR